MISPRHCALEILHETIQNGSYPNLLYNQRTKNFDDRDRKLITLLIFDCLSNLIHIDYILKQYIGDKKVKPIIRNILRMAVDQIAFLQFPEHAVINESVKLCDEIKKPMLKGFVNGVLRNYVRNPKIIYPKENTLEYFSIKNSKPMWLMELWEKDYGFDEAVRFSNVRNVGTTVRFKNGFEGKEWLEEKGYPFSKVDFIDNSYILDSSYDIFNTAEYKKGVLSIQGIGSMVACKALDAKTDEHVLDACSAPGGKTVNICSAMKSGKVVACDLYENRINLVKQNVKRCGYNFVECFSRDMSQSYDDFINKFDRVLVDAPCSGLGEINSKPDIILNKSLDDVFELSKLQLKILDCCCDYVKSGGVLVYSTCTINKIENDRVVLKFLEKHKEYSLESFSLDDGKIIESGMLQLTPDTYDGFFVAKFRKQ